MPERLKNEDAIIPNAPINEGIALLNKLSKYDLDDLERRYPLLSGNLKIGILAGPEKEGDPDVRLTIAREKARFMLETLDVTKNAANAALASVSQKVKSARVERLVSQILVLIGSSSSLATLALGRNRAAVVSAVLTLIAALGNLLADYQEKLLNPQAGNIYDAFQRLSEGLYKMEVMSSDLRLALKYEQDAAPIENQVASSNVLCEEIKKYLIQLIATVTTNRKAAIAQSLAF